MAEPLFSNPDGTLIWSAAPSRSGGWQRAGQAVLHGPCDGHCRRTSQGRDLVSDIFVQAAPQLGNHYLDDHFLRSYLQRKVPAATLSTIAPDLDQLGAIAGGELYSLQLADREKKPTLVQWTPVATASLASRSRRCGAAPLDSARPD